MRRIALFMLLMSVAYGGAAGFAQESSSNSGAQVQGVTPEASNDAEAQPVIGFSYFL